MPSPFEAEIGTTGMPSSDSILLMSTDPPLPRISSIMLRASTMGTLSSISCIVRYRPRSMLVASRMLMTPFGFSSRMNSRETISSLVYGESE